ncbi:hypothetical protein MMC31_005955 [Peltigera leucophlebia]|nr:hypothetical protein [Peltigera leucophlebia]
MNLPSLDTDEPEGEEMLILLDQMSILFDKKHDTNGVYDTIEKLEKLKDYMLMLSSELEKLRTENKILLEMLKDEAFTSSESTSLQIIKPVDNVRATKDN